MTTLFLDSSALVKRYLTENGSVWVLRQLDIHAGNVILTAEITRVEVAAAIASRQRAQNGITRAERDMAVDMLLNHFDREYRIIPIDRDVIRIAVGLTQNYRLRGYDAVQLATALSANIALVAAGLQRVTFVASDNALLDAAHKEGLAVVNPN